jgi:predicted AAA+ superfamily ATPase
MFRRASALLRAWIGRRARKPLLIRGARQVGKTWLVRDLARQERRELVELNFERSPRHELLFESNDPRRILDDIELALGRRLTADGSLLFLDEIQAAPNLISKLRWFAEDLPEMPVIAAGSLLEFALTDPELRMPVGRVTTLGIAPMSFEEFLSAHGQSTLIDRCAEWSPGADLSTAVHAKATEYYERFMMVGGMPEVVAADVAGQPASEVRRLQTDLLTTFRDDFARYARRVEPRVLDAVLGGVVAALGRKLVVARLADELRRRVADDALRLLTQARLCLPVLHTAANGLPLSAQAKPRSKKVLLLDVGLAHALIGTPAARVFPRWRDLAPQVRGQLTEQVVGQELHCVTADHDGTPRLYYWHREGGRAGEVDFVLSAGTRILPVELKSGAAGAMKSLHQFMFDKRLDVAVRCDSNPPSLLQVGVLTTQGDRVDYDLLSLPHYLASRAVDLAGPA